VLQAAIGAERVLRGRTGFKPSGLRNELPDFPVPSDKQINERSRLYVPESRAGPALGRRFNQDSNFGNGTTLLAQSRFVSPPTHHLSLQQLVVM
jgi:hypothetical protein